MHTNNSHYRDYQRMLVQLHALIAQGAAGSAEAAALREEMEMPEGHLSRDELVHLNALSGDLSMIHGREIADKEVVDRIPRPQLPNLIRQAYERKDWDEMLMLLRADVSEWLKADQIAYMRARCYAELMELSPAIAFMEAAARLNAANVNYWALTMELLWKDGAFEEAYRRAEGHLADPATPNRLVLMAGTIISRSAQQDPSPGDIDAAVAQAMRRMEQALPNETATGILFAGFGTLGLLAAQVGETGKAEAALKEAIQLPVQTENLLSVRALIICELEMIRAGQLKSSAERALARQLADIIVPDAYALAA